MLSPAPWLPGQPRRLLLIVGPGPLLCPLPPPSPQRWILPGDYPARLGRDASEGTQPAALTEEMWRPQRRALHASQHMWPGNSEQDTYRGSKLSRDAEGVRGRAPRCARAAPFLLSSRCHRPVTQSRAQATHPVPGESPWPVRPPAERCGPAEEAPWPLGWLCCSDLCLLWTRGSGPTVVSSAPFSPGAVREAGPGWEEPRP